LKTKKKTKAFIAQVQQEADAKAEAAVAKAEAKRNARDAVIRSAKRAVLHARSLNQGKPTHGDVSQYAEKYKIKREELRTALQQAGRNDVRAVAGRPTKVTQSQEHFLAKEVEGRAMESRAMSKSAVAGAMGAIAQANNSAFETADQGAVPSRRTMDRLCRRRGFISATTNETEKARLVGVSKKNIATHFERYKATVLDPNPCLKERVRHANLDETPQSGRGEKLNRRMYALVTKKVLKKLKGQGVRSQAIDDGYEGISFVPVTLGDASVLAKIFIVSADKVNPKWTAKPPAKLPTSHEFLPRMPLNYFEVGNVGIYANKSGVMTSETFEAVLKFIIPLWRKKVPDGPLVLHMDAPESHQMSKTLAAFLKENGIIAHFFPHKTSTHLQPLDLKFNKEWRRLFRAIVDALITVGQNSHAYLDDTMKAKFSAAKK